MQVTCESHGNVPFENALQGSPRYVLHEDIDSGHVHAGAQVADDVPVLHAAQNGHLSLNLPVLLNTEQTKLKQILG